MQPSSITWTITPSRSPEPILPCSTCGTQKPFYSSGKARLNANGRKLDAWLIYKCVDCSKTWNCPLFERKPVGGIDPVALAALHSNDPAWIRQQEFNRSILRRHTHHIAEFAGYKIIKSANISSCCEIKINLPFPMTLRLDRLLAAELRVPRSKLAELFQRGKIAVLPHREDALRHKVKNGMVVKVG